VGGYRQTEISKEVAVIQTSKAVGYDVREIRELLDEK
jgi:hypothetical protein